MLVLLLALLLLWPQSTLAAQTVGFSQVKTAGTVAGDEFIELLNTGEVAADLTGYKVVKETTSGNQYTITTLGAAPIPAHSYLLLALESGIFSGVADIKYKTALANNNKLLLIDTTGQTVDSLAWGDGQALPNHTSNQSFQRDWQAATSQWGPWSAQLFSQAHHLGDIWSSPTPETPSEPVADPASPPPDPTPTTTEPAPTDPIPTEPVSEPAPEPAPTPEPPAPVVIPEPVVEPAPTPTISSEGSIRINEIYANPAGEEAAGEFIELFNAGNDPVDLSLWKIADKTSSTPLTGQIITGHGYLVLTHTISKLTINNSDEVISLIDSHGALRNQVAISTSHEGQSLNWAESGPWYEAAPSPGSTNTAIIADPLPAPTAPIISAPTIDTSSNNTDVQIPEDWSASITAEPATPPPPQCPSYCATNESVVSTAKSTTTGANKSAQEYQAMTFAQWPRVANKKAVMLGGAVVVLPGTFGERTAFLQPVDEKAGGIELFFSKALWPDLELGDVIAVRGHKSKSKLGERLLIAAPEDIRVIDHVDIAPLDLKLAALNKTLANEIVRIMPERLIVDKKQLIAFVGSLELPINLQKAHIDLPDMDNKAAFPIIGLLKGGAKPQLWPRSDDDLLIDQVLTQPTAAGVTDTPDTAEMPLADQKKSESVSSVLTQKAPNVVASATVSAPPSPWLLGSLTFATSGGGLAWYFFQEQLKKRAADILSSIRKVKV